MTHDMGKPSIDIEIKSKIGPRTYHRFLMAQEHEEVCQAELIRRALKHYFTHLDEERMRLVSLMQQHSDRSE